MEALEKAIYTGCVPRLALETSLNPILLHVLVVVFVATLIRSAFGFGEALIAVPLLALRIAVGVAAPLAVLVSVTVAAIIVIQDWRKIHFRSAGFLVLSTVFGIPLGLLLLTAADERLVKALLSIVIAFFAIYSLSARSRLFLTRDHRVWLFGCGFLAGVLGGAYGMNGPPLVVYGTMRRWSPQHFRGDASGLFSACQLDWHGWLQRHRLLGPGGHTLLSAVLAADFRCGLPRPHTQSSIRRRYIPEVCLFRTDRNRCPAARAGDSRILASIPCLKCRNTGSPKGPKTFLPRASCVPAFLRLAVKYLEGFCYPCRHHLITISPGDNS